MVRVGVPSWIDPELLAIFSRDLEVVPIAAEAENSVDVEFWVVPPFGREAAQVFPRLRGVRVAQSLLAGVDLLKPLLPHHVILCDGQGMHNIPTAEWVVAAILNALKYFPLYGALQRNEDWRGRREADAFYRSFHGIEQISNPPVLQEELYGKRVLIVGYGSIGRSIEERLLPFGVTITRVARTEREGIAPVARLAELLPDADIVVLIVPQTEETRGMMGAKELSLMKRGALLVNAARGPVVDTDALITALESRRIRAALDVTDPEPLPAGHPLWTAPNVFITPHVAASSPMLLRRAITFAAQQAERYSRGEPLLNVVTGSY